MKKTNNKEVRKAIRDHIFEFYDGNYQNFENNAKAVCIPGRENYLQVGARKLAENGEFLVAVFDARGFLEEILDQKDSSKYGDEQVWSLYCYLIGAEGSKILHNGGWLK